MLMEFKAYNSPVNCPPKKLLRTLYSAVINNNIFCYNLWKSIIVVAFAKPLPAEDFNIYYHNSIKSQLLIESRFFKLIIETCYNLFLNKEYNKCLLRAKKKKLESIRSH